MNHDEKVNEFSRFFGTILTELKYHDLGLKKQPHPVLIEDTTKSVVSRTSAWEFDGI